MVNMPKNLDSGRSCFHCKHFDTQYRGYDPVSELSFITEDHPNCIAFPDGIPSELYNNGHYEPRPDLGQKNEVVFEKDPEKK